VGAAVASREFAAACKAAAVSSFLGGGGFKTEHTTYAAIAPAAADATIVWKVLIALTLFLKINIVRRILVVGPLVLA
jgi:hypothetical protein